MNRHFPEYSSRLVPTARMLRKKMTEPERKLWLLVRNNQLGMKFRRQLPMGPYVADFYCAKARLDVELDGNQHYTESGRLSDRKRDDYFASVNVRVVRYRNAEIIKNIDGVITDILEHMHVGTSHETNATSVQ